MSNIIQFKPRAVTPPSPPVVEVQSPTEEPAQPVAYPINETAAGQVVETLLFYARQGWDGGAKAKKALLGMRTVINSNDAA